MKSMVIVGSVMMVGCASSTYHRVNQVSFVASSALMLCDAASTVQMSNEGRWNREMEGGLLREQNPLLGSTPSIPTLVGIAAVDLAVNAAIYRSSLPEWAKASWFGAITLVEGAVVTSNARFAGMCGVGPRMDAPLSLTRR